MLEDIKIFPQENFEKTSTILIIGKRAVGKTTIVRKIVSKKKNIANGLIIDPTNKHYYSHIRNLQKIDEYNPKVLHSFVNKLFNDREPSLLILNQCFMDSSYIKDRALLSVLQNSHCLNTSIIWVQQYAQGIPMCMAFNIDIVIILHESSNYNRKRLYDKYANFLESFIIFNALMDELTNTSYNALLIDNRIDSDDMYERIFQYKVDLHDI